MKRAFPIQAFLILITIAVFVWSVHAQSNLVVTWRSDVAQTIGNGHVASSQVVQFRVSRTLTNVSVFVVPEIRRFVRIEPSEFENLQPSQNYSIKITFYVPTRADEGRYDGLIHLRRGTETIPEPLKVRINVSYDGNVPSRSAATLSPDSLRLISGIVPNNDGISFSRTNSELAELKPGTILALPPANRIPHGFLGKIVKRVEDGERLFLSTTNASLSEALDSAEIKLDHRLSPEDLSSSSARSRKISSPAAFTTALATGFTASTHSTAQGLSVVLSDLEVDRGVFFDGRITVAPQLHFTFRFRNSRLDQLAFYIKSDESVELNIKSQKQKSLDAEKEFKSYRWKPIVIWAGWIPIVVVPETSLVAGAKGTALVGMQVGVQQTAVVTAGVELNNGYWHPIYGFSSSLSSKAPNDQSFSAGAKIKGFVGLRLKLLLYDVVGPRVDIGAFGELDIDVFRTPIWQIFGGLEANSGVLLRILDRTMADQNFPLIVESRRLIVDGGVSGNGRIVRLRR